MFGRNTVIVNLNDYLDLIRKAEKLEAILEQTFSIGKSWRDKPEVVVNVKLHEERFRQLLEESEFAGEYLLPEYNKNNYWTHEIDVFQEIPKPEEEEF